MYKYLIIIIKLSAQLSVVGKKFGEYFLYSDQRQYVWS